MVRIGSRILTAAGKGTPHRSLFLTKTLQTLINNCVEEKASKLMDGREGMAMPSSYYLHRGGIGGSGGPGPGHNIHGAGGSSASGPSGMIHTSPVFKTLSNPNIPVQSSVGAASGSFHVEDPSPNFPHGMSMAVVSSAAQSAEQPVKKKRGRPRKYGPDGSNMSLGLSPTPPSKPSSAVVVTPGERARRGRPPGTGWKQKLAPLGEWMNSSAGVAFAPHVLHIGVGEDVAAKILAFARQRPRALCIMSGNGSVSAVTLRHPTASGSIVTYEGRFEILCLSGSYLVAETGSPRDRTGGISISVCSPDGHIIGGAIGGRLIAANPVQVVGCSFVYGGTKGKTKAGSEIKDEKSPNPITVASTHGYNPNSGASMWPPGHRPEDIDLTSG
ncbi:AT-hook motif nuclear-localized protein 5-like [Andrographis paniculata]|uniref:AT-hook motif nuclear-localized protein 5-like n=1 Tax=Andrographis paniculata TaxID=175694 RepID=UPI0021E7CBFF|nr:AT-hook motif nuclear-localized protein 5-like [Andrographis paniculata]